MTDEPQWLTWARQLQAIAQTGLTFTKDVFDQERYQAVRRIAAEMAAAGAGIADSQRILDLFSHDSGYATPKVDVRSAVFRDDHILLVKEHEDGCWTLPGGWADVGDAPSLAAVREVKEESGYDVVATKLAAIFDRNLHGHPPFPFHAYKLYFLCELVGGEAAVSHETDAVDFFPEDQIPPLSLTRVTPAIIAHLFEHHRHPEWPTSFD
ncbi:NUDIX hydrolase [uncultured Paludibaculum sp.]|uniref:NUDIX hydrolase n=1 Tax=uncultured Paludibaculum sp. TaxID=1765020 RepID=UPI002AAAC22E|nr:NUDIX hydrolase [uncultured Paludibaculum sp.]